MTPKPPEKPHRSISISFFPLVISICSGSAIFKKLLHFNYFRALSHLILLSILCYTLIVISRSGREHAYFNKVCSSLQESFGDITVKNNQLLPAIKPEERRHLIINTMTSFYYFPSNSDEELKHFLKTAKPFNIIWTPTTLISCIRRDKDSFYVSPLSLSLASATLTTDKQIPMFHLLKQKKLITYIQNTPYPFTKQTTSFTAYTNELTYIFLGLLCLKLAIVSLFYPIMIGTCYCLINSFLRSKPFINFSLSRTLTIATYASFPALIIASLFQAARITAIQFEIVFIFSFIIYFFHVINKLERELLLKTRQQNRNNNKS